MWGQISAKQLEHLQEYHFKEEHRPAKLHCNDDSTSERPRLFHNNCPSCCPTKNGSSLPWLMGQAKTERRSALEFLFCKHHIPGSNGRHRYNKLQFLNKTSKSNLDPAYAGCRWRALCSFWVERLPWQNVLFYEGPTYVWQNAGWGIKSRRDAGYEKYWGRDVGWKYVCGIGICKFQLLGCRIGLKLLVGCGT